LRRQIWKSVIAFAALVTSTTSFAQKTETVNFGITTVKLSSTFTNALADLKVTPGTVAPTNLRNGVVDFPITGGAIDLDTAEGNILHSGGLTLEANGIQVRLQSFIIDTTGSTPVITGLVVARNKLVGRLPLFDLAVPSGITPLHPRYGVVLELTGIPVSLDPTAASALNTVYSIHAFAGGLSIGTASVDAILASPNPHFGW
jgi:hypothetical protein